MQIGSKNNALLDSLRLLVARFNQSFQLCLLRSQRTLLPHSSMGQQAPCAHQPDWSVLLQPHLDLQQLSHLHSKRVLLRADLNLPLTTSGAVADSTRLDSVLPTLQTLTAKGARVVLCSHLGRPDAAAASAQNSSQEGLSLAPVAALLAVRLPPGVFAGLVADCVGPVAADAVAALQPGQVRVCGTDWALNKGTGLSLMPCTALHSLAQPCTAFRAHSSLGTSLTRPEEA
jgi:hypothetical protein